jgi:hypothetical protein
MAWKRSLLPWFGPGILGGITLGDWWRLLRDNRFAISPRYLPRALTITGHAISNSLFRVREIGNTTTALGEVLVPPPFLVRPLANGTTLLHNLISTDTRFALPTPIGTFPQAFLTTEKSPHC